MDDPFRTAERLLSEASNSAEIKRALSGLFLAIFQDRPRAKADMAKIMMRTLGRADDMDGQRQLARMLVQSVEAELRR